MGNDRRPVCFRCAQIKQACDGCLPCSRCTRLGLPCRPRDPARPRDSKDGRNGGANLEIGAEASSDATSQDSPAVDPLLPKARIRRVQTGCLMCKRRKKKCDESKPKCGDCRRLCLDCVWPADRPKGAANKAVVLTANARPQRTVVTAMAAAPAVTTAETSASPIACLDGFAMVTDTGVYSPSSSSVSGSANGSTNSRLDSMSIIQNSGSTESLVKTEQTSWTSSPCELPWFEQYTPMSTNHSPPESVSSLTLSTYVPQLMPQLTSPHDRALMNHYTNVVSKILSRHPSSSNPYNQYLLPVAHSNELVLHCILALSGNHWRKLQPSMANRGLIHQSKAQQALAQLLPHVNQTTSADIALVSSLLLCMTELFDGTSQGWEVHLKGAKRLLSTLRRQNGELWTSQNKFLLRLSRFLDSAATTSTCRPPLMEEEANEARALEGLAAASPEDEDSAVYGIPKELFHLVDQVNTLAEKRKYRVDAASEAQFREDAAEVEQMINFWSRENARSARAVSRSSFSTSTDPARSEGDDVDDVENATAAYEHALRLRLHQVIEGYNVHDPQVRSSVSAIIDAVQRIRYGSPLEACLLFPLVMAGGACQSLEQRVVVQDKLMVMERTCGFGYVYNARQLVEKVWMRRDEAGGDATDVGASVNWAKIRYEEMHGLVVF